jgi:hypothetical protein
MNAPFAGSHHRANFATFSMAKAAAGRLIYRNDAIAEQFKINKSY